MTDPKPARRDGGPFGVYVAMRDAEPIAFRFHEEVTSQEAWHISQRIRGLAERVERLLMESDTWKMRAAHYRRQRNEARADLDLAHRLAIGLTMAATELQAEADRDLLSSHLEPSVN